MVALHKVAVSFGDREGECCRMRQKTKFSFRFVASFDGGFDIKVLWRRAAPLTNQRPRPSTLWRPFVDLATPAAGRPRQRTDPDKVAAERVHLRFRIHPACRRRPLWRAILPRTAAPQSVSSSPPFVRTRANASRCLLPLPLPLLPSPSSPFSFTLSSLLSVY